jgi:hypothetical protein
MPRFEFESGTFLWFYAITFIFGLCGESYLLVLWCAGGRCNMAGSDEDRDKSRRPSADDRGWSNTCQVLSARTIGMSGDVVRDLHRAQGDKERRFLS